jgi:hypothetical protein
MTSTPLLVYCTITYMYVLFILIVATIICYHLIVLFNAYEP